MTTTSELRSRLERQTADISHIAHRIENRLEEYIDWPGMVRQYPLQSLGVAALAGLFLTGASGPIGRSVVKQVGTLVQAGITATIVSSVSQLTKPQNL